MHDIEVTAEANLQSSVLRSIGTPLRVYEAPCVLYNIRENVTSQIDDTTYSHAVLMIYPRIRERLSRAVIGYKDVMTYFKNSLCN